jgi:hypothetical protein
MPDGYGIPESTSGTLPWSFVDEQMLTARNYWVVTVRPDGRPHAMPVCYEEEPSLQKVNGGRLISCHLYQRED